MYATKALVLIASLFSALSQACPLLERHTADVALRIRQEHACPTYTYDRDGLDWPEEGDWGECGRGHQQSPISLPAGSFSSMHTPIFGFPEDKEVPGRIYNRCFGPEWAPRSDAVPTISFDEESYDLLQWHTHTPSSEHAFGGIRQDAEIHFVFGTGLTPHAVAAIGIENGDDVPFFSSAFDDDLEPVASSDDHEVDLDFETILNPTQFRDYWTYRGSLTTPGCNQGIRWFVAASTTTLTRDQFKKLNEASSNSVRALQEVHSEHELNF